MTQGTLIAESLRRGAALEHPGMTVSRIVRVGPIESVTKAQPDTWTFEL